MLASRVVVGDGDGSRFLSIQTTVARRSSARFSQRYWFSMFFCRSAKKISMAALSAYASTLPLEPCPSTELIRWMYFLDGIQEDRLMILAKNAQ